MRVTAHSSLRFTVLADENIKALYDNRGKPVPASVPPVVVGRYLYIVGNQLTTIDLAAAGSSARPGRCETRRAQLHPDPVAGMTWTWLSMTKGIVTAPGPGN